MLKIRTPVTLIRRSTSRLDLENASNGIFIHGRMVAGRDARVQGLATKICNHLETRTRHKESPPTNEAKPGIVVVRVRLRRGGARKPRPVSGRRQKAMGSSKFTRSLSLRTVAEGRAARRYPNLKIQNSYRLFSDGVSHWYEVILIDPQRPGLQ